METLQDKLVIVPLDARTQGMRAKSIRLLLDGIESYGIDSASLLRYGMRTSAITPILVLVLSDLLPTGRGPRFFDSKIWSERLAIPESTSPMEPKVGSDGSFTFPIAGGAAGVARLLERWVDRAEMQDIIDLRPPDPEFFGQLDLPVLASEVVEPYRWLAVRYSGRDFQTWDRESLRLEFLAREKEWSPPFAADIELLPAGERDGLLHEMARRFAGAKEADVGPEQQLFAQLQRQATHFLEAGRYREAAALFEFYLRSYPSELSAMNNMAFCLIPIDSELALHHLTESASRGFSPLTVNIYNQCCCLRELGRSGEALEIAEYHWQRGLDSDPISGTLWKRSSDSWDLYSEPDCAVALAHLACELSVLANRPDRKGRWEERANKTKQLDSPELLGGLGDKDSNRNRPRSG
jgi:tetratricopeptide (TPR) repeat protein